MPKPPLTCCPEMQQTTTLCVSGDVMTLRTSLQFQQMSSDEGKYEGIIQFNSHSIELTRLAPLTRYAFAKC